MNNKEYAPFRAIPLRVGYFPVSRWNWKEPHTFDSEVLEWCDENIVNDMYFCVVDYYEHAINKRDFLYSVKLYICFNSDRDYVAFKMRWL